MAAILANAQAAILPAQMHGIWHRFALGIQHGRRHHAYLLTGANPSWRRLLAEQCGARLL